VQKSCGTAGYTVGADDRRGPDSGHRGAAPAKRMLPWACARVGGLAAPRQRRPTPSAAPGGGSAPARSASQGRGGLSHKSRVRIMLRRVSATDAAEKVLRHPGSIGHIPRLCSDPPMNRIPGSTPKCGNARLSCATPSIRKPSAGGRPQSGLAGTSPSGFGPAKDVFLFYVSSTIFIDGPCGRWLCGRDAESAALFKPLIE